MCNSGLGFVFPVPHLPSVDASALETGSAWGPHLEPIAEEVAGRLGTRGLAIAEWKWPLPIDLVD